MREQLLICTDRIGHHLGAKRVVPKSVGITVAHGSRCSSLYASAQARPMSERMCSVRPWGNSVVVSPLSPVAPAVLAQLLHVTWRRAALTS